MYSNYYYLCINSKCSLLNVKTWYPHGVPDNPKCSECDTEYELKIKRDASLED